MEKAIVESLQPLLIYSKFVRKLKIDDQMKKRGIESYGQGQGENTVTSSETFGKGQGWNTVFNRKSFGEGQGRINAAIAYWYKICKKVIDNGHYLQ